MKPGVKSSELWVTVGGIMAMLLIDAGYVSGEPDDVTKVIVGGLTALYGLYRTFVKINDSR